VLSYAVNIAVCWQVTAAEYTRLYLTALKDTLNMYPPPQPSTAAVNLLVTVGQQQEFLIWHSLLPPPGHPGSLDALAVSPSPHLLLSRCCQHLQLCVLCQIYAALHPNSCALQTAGLQGNSTHARQSACKAFDK